MLQTLKKNKKSKKFFYGINSGNYGFLMNKFSPKTIIKNLSKANMITISPLEMTVTTNKNQIRKYLAINEVSILRQSRQAASLSIHYGSKQIIKKLVSDGVLVSTPAGSTAYNLSAHGPIIPLRSRLLALTPISAFRPRRWRGALLHDETVVRMEVQSPDRRPVSATADSTEFRDIAWVQVTTDKGHGVTLLFDEGQHLDERIIREQFLA